MNARQQLFQGPTGLIMCLFSIVGNKDYFTLLALLRKALDMTSLLYQEHAELGEQGEEQHQLPGLPAGGLVLPALDAHLLPPHTLPSGEGQNTNYDTIFKIGF